MVTYSHMSIVASYDSMRNRHSQSIASAATLLLLHILPGALSSMFGAIKWLG